MSLKVSLPSFSSQSGQVAVVILLLMVIILTVGISVASRTTEELLTSRQTSDSARVFNAAESGVDEALSQLQTSFETGSLADQGSLNVNNSNVNYQIVSSTTLETRVDEGVSVMVALVNQTVTPTGLPAAGSPRRLQIQWSNAGLDTDCSSSQRPASLLISTYSVTSGVGTSRVQAIEGCGRSDGFGPQNSAANTPYRFRYDLDLAAGDLLVRIKPLYKGTQLQVTGQNLTLPTQNYLITAEARNQTGNETKKIQVDRTLPAAPSIMDYTLFSGATLTKTP